MFLVLFTIFWAIFIITVLLLTAVGADTTQYTERTVAVLRAALSTTKLAPSDQAVDLHKEELLSAVPWLNRWLLKLELAPRLRTLLYQADVKWTAGGLLLMSAACFLIPAYLIYLRTGAVILSLLLGLMLGAAPFVYVINKRKKRFDKFEQELP